MLLVLLLEVLFVVEEVRVIIGGVEESIEWRRLMELVENRDVEWVLLWSSVLTGGFWSPPSGFSSTL